MPCTSRVDREMVTNCLCSVLMVSGEWGDAITSCCVGGTVKMSVGTCLQMACIVCL